MDYSSKSWAGHTHVTCRCGIELTLGSSWWEALAAAEELEKDLESVREWVEGRGVLEH